jgi:hypothetical protein
MCDVTRVTVRVTTTTGGWPTKKTPAAWVDTNAVEGRRKRSPGGLLTRRVIALAPHASARGTHAHTRRSAHLHKKGAARRQVADLEELVIKRGVDGAPLVRRPVGVAAVRWCVALRCVGGSGEVWRSVAGWCTKERERAGHQHTHTHTRARARTHTHTHTHTHSHTHTHL